MNERIGTITPDQTRPDVCILILGFQDTELILRNTVRELWVCSTPYIDTTHNMVRIVWNSAITVLMFWLQFKAGNLYSNDISGNNED
jgi:hypothetical protein